MGHLHIGESPFLTAQTVAPSRRLWRSGRRWRWYFDNKHYWHPCCWPSRIPSSFGHGHSAAA